ncbi:VOC family protein [Halostagnicola sp. A-GB9-2]|uniref:VOC family protein n=1 Tax=Halostagnicola sp. A-GB9-2 TaxID=3048066 RepID=UPI0024BFAD2C|nr:VOC family protein [Halostagnicola sp. A-GB9-2]MDJ1434705.1 VOC family protein [Halostagnicola sp. A-GB9-2]
MIGEIDHIEIEASNAEEMAGFLKKLGYEELRTTEHHGESFELEPSSGDGPLFEIHTVEGEEVPGINHIAFGVDDIDEVSEQLAEEDIDSIVGPYDVEETGRTITNFRDPDGRRFQVVSDDE